MHDQHIDIADQLGKHWVCSSLVTAEGDADLTNVYAVANGRYVAMWDTNTP